MRNRFKTCQTIDHSTVRVTSRFFFFLALTFACSGHSWTNDLIDGRSLKPASLDEALKDVKSGTVLVISEHHGFVPHYQNQKALLNKLGTLNQSVTVGLEFFERQYQTLVDQYAGGLLNEVEFLKGIRWGSIPFDFYREQALFGPSHGGTTRAINADRALTGRIAKVGIGGLTTDELAQLPTHFELGNQNYFERFKAAMGQHVPPESIQKYFEAQSVWDETMADQTAQFLQKNPNQVFVIIVGDFHAAYGGGLPHRLIKRGVQNVIVVSQVNGTDLTDQEIQDEIAPHPQWGPRGNFIWVSKN